MGGWVGRTEFFTARALTLSGWSSPREGGVRERVWVGGWVGGGGEEEEEEEEGGGQSIAAATRGVGLDALRLWWCW